jgi:hypothetical protein
VNGEASLRHPRHLLRCDAEVIGAMTPEALEVTVTHVSISG